MLKVCGKFHDVSSIDSSLGGKEMQLNNKEVEIENNTLKKGTNKPVAQNEHGVKKRKKAEKTGKK